MSEPEVLKIIYYIDKFTKETFINTKPTKENRILTSSSNVVGEGSVIAKIIGVDDPEYDEKDPNIEEFTSAPSSYSSETVQYNGKTKEFISKLYGFAILKDNKFNILSLFEIENNYLEGYLYIYPTIKKEFPTIAEVKKILKDNNITKSVDENIIEQEIDKIKADKTKLGVKILIAEGVKPIDGIVEILELKKVFKKSVGKELENGRINYKEKSLFNKINKGEVIIERMPKTLPKDGMDIFGKTIKGNMTGNNLYKIGNAIVPKEEGSNIYISSTNGIINIDENGVVSVEEKLTIDGDVDLSIGNIHFTGFIEVGGNVQPGFELNGTKDIVIHGNIEDASVKTDGSITVENGILGKESCKVYAGGNINVRFIQNADITANKDIIVSESIVQGKCFARGHVKVTGHIVGGEITGLMGLEAGVLGGASGAKTVLVVGKDVKTEESINKLTDAINQHILKLKSIIGQITVYFGENALSDVKRLIEGLPANRKKQFLSMLKNIKNINNNIVKLKVELEKLKTAIDFATPPTIKIHDGVFPGITVRIKNSIKKIEEKLNYNITFKEDDKLKVIYWD